MNKRQQLIYAALAASPPTSDMHGWGSAYFRGYRNPDMLADAAGPSVGHPGSEARAAFMAGRDRARRERKATPKAEAAPPASSAALH